MIASHQRVSAKATIWLASRDVFLSSASMLVIRADDHEHLGSHQGADEIGKDRLARIYR